MGGGNSWADSRPLAAQGLSPRGRGKRNTDVPHSSTSRSIPAWAGETVTRWSTGIFYWVYPRVGGGNGVSYAVVVSVAGLSPRGRGKPARLRLQEIYPGSIPAWAGETLGIPRSVTPAEVYPRVGGGNHTGQHIPSYINGLSPRGRGKQSRAGISGSRRRSIPAWAGETRASAPAHCRYTVYPRVGGGNRSSGSIPAPDRGLSPRGRGKPRQGFRVEQMIRSIPAWAGETRKV